jgi:hypothetical protein
MHLTFKASAVLRNIRQEIKNMRSKIGILVLLVCIFSMPAFAQRYAIFPEIVSGNGWSCELYFTNQDIYGVEGIEVGFFDEDGSPVSLETNLGTFASHTFDLAAGATQVIRIVSSGDYVEGYAVVYYPSNGSPVRATEVYRFESEGTVSVEVGVPQQEYGSNFSFPVEVNSGGQVLTAVVLANPQVYQISTEQTIILSLINADGSLQATAKMPLEAGEHFAGYLQEAELFPGLDNFTGSISISSPWGVGVLALRQDKQAFGAISTDGGPVMGPFALGGTSISEQEPNDDDTNAQLIVGSAKIEGTIGSADDLDSFKFTGQAGDVITVICDAQLDGSYLDSILEIYDGNLELIGQNDQNGLAPELYPVNDSFIQMELPANGTYYIVVRDYYGDAGGPDFYYTLHVNLP